jgi:hypothetical protein
MSLDSEDDLDLPALSLFCGEVVEGLSEGEVSDLCDLHTLPRKKKIYLQEKEV